MKEKHFKTNCVHSGNVEDIVHKGSTSPLYMSTSYAFEEVEINQYPRYFNTPNQRGLSEKVASLEGAESGLIFSSGMAAISTTLFSHLRAGDHVIFQNDLYGGTRNFVKKELLKYQIEFSFTQGLSIEDIMAERRPNTKGIYVESPSNPTLQLVNLKELALWAKSEGLWTIIDNTFATPVNQNPIALGIDIVIHSATKYLGGHSDICAGAVVGERKSISKVYEVAKNLGGNLSDATVWLLERSIKTLSLRVEAQNNNAQQLALFLEEQSWIKRVYYPGLPSHPNHDLAKAQMKGFGGMLSFELDPNIKVSEFLSNIILIKPSMSLAGVESTALSPRLTSHALLTEEERLDQGITPQLIRFSCGIEAVEDLQEDLENAIKNCSL